MMSISTSCSSHVSFDRSNSSDDLSVWSSFAPLICICTTAPNGLPALAFADSKRSHCKWIQNAHRTLRKKPIKRASGKLRHCKRRMEAQRPEGAFDARVAARFDFVSPRLMLMMTNAGRDRSLTCSRPSLTVAAK